MNMHKNTTKGPTRGKLFWSLVLAAPVVTGGVLAWIFSLDGTLGLYQTIAPVRILVIAMAVLAVGAPLLALLAGRLKALRSIAVVLAILGLVIPLAIGGFYLNTALKYAAVTPPVLLIADGSGANGVPNLVLVFRTAQPTQNTLAYGEGSLSQKIAEPKAASEHVLALKDLKPGTNYQWQLNDGPTCSFTTPSVQATSDPLYHFAVGSDLHLSSSMTPPASGDPDVVQRVLKVVQAASPPIQALYTTGDLVNTGSVFKDWEFALTTIAPYTCSFPLRPLMGNRDTMFNGGAQYETYLYPQGMQTQTGTRSYYRIDAGPVHILMLKMIWGADSFGAEQRAWFSKQMESIPTDDWTIVMMHSMLYASGSILGGVQYYDPVDMVQQVVPLLEKYKVDLVISGHDHDLEFLQKNGVSYAVNGGMGAPLSPVAAVKSQPSVWYLPQQHGFLDVTIHPTTIELHFRDPDGKELKSFSIGQNR